MSKDRATDINVSELRQKVRAGWGKSFSDPEAVTSAALASAELADRAYRQNDREARRQAETIIYRLNLESCFAPPADPTASTVWAMLMQAKLASLRREFGQDAGGESELGKEELRERLEGAVAKWGAYNHPVLDDLQKSGNLDAYRAWAKNWFGSCYGFSLQLASLVQRTSGEAKKVVLENLNDEFDDKVTHDTLRIRFYESLDLRHSPEDAIDDPDWVLDSTELLNLRTGLCALSNPMAALGCFYSVEANWPAECRRHLEMNKARGLDDHTLEYWTTHAFADEHHSAEWLDVVEATCRTSAERAAVVEGAIVQLRLRWRMYDAIQERVRALS